MASNSTHTLHSLSQTFQRTFFFIEHHFPPLLFAIALPTIVSMLIFWTGISVTLSQLNQISSSEELFKVFSFVSPTSYMLFLMMIALFCLNVLGLIAGPLVLIERERIKITTIIPRALHYFFPYLKLMLLLGGATVVLYIISYLLITIISTVIGFINLAYLDSTFMVLASIIPNVGLIIMATFFMFAPFILIEKNISAYQALVTSATLVWAHFWHLVLRLIIVLGAVLLLSFLLLFIPYVGYALSLFVSTLIMTTYTYVLYQDVTATPWR